MEELSPKIQGIRMADRDDGTYHLILVTQNEMWADVLRHTLSEGVVLGYTYDGYDITWYLVFELPHIDKMFKVPVNASFETRKWLNRIDERSVTRIWVAHPDGKGGMVYAGASIMIRHTANRG